MRALVILLLSCLCSSGQGTSCAALRNPVNVALHRPLSSNEIYSLSPTAWFMSDIGVFNDGGSTPAADGDTVQQWNDVSANGFNLYQPTAGNRPVFHTVQINGYPAVFFNAGSSWLTNTFGVSNSQPVTYFMVEFPSNNWNSGVLIDGVKSAAQPITWFTSSGSAFILSLQGQDGGSQKDVTGTGVKQKGVWYQHTTYFESSKSVIFVYTKIRRTGDASACGTIGITLGGNLAHSNGLGGRIAEVIIFTQFKLPEVYRVGIELYLKQKYALPQPF